MAVPAASKGPQQWRNPGFHTSFAQLLLAVFLATFMLNAPSVKAQSDPDDNPKGTLLPTSMATGTPFTWCDYGLVNVAGSGGAISIKMTQKEGDGAGARIHTPQRYAYGNFSAMVKCPAGNTTGLNFNVYTSSRETAGINSTQDEIDFEFLGKNKTIVQVNYYVNGNATTNGKGNEEVIDLGFDCTDAFHEYRIDWSPFRIKWFIDGRLVRSNFNTFNTSGRPYPTLPSFLYSSIWDASDVDNGHWTGGPNTYRDAPFMFQLSNISATELADKSFNDNVTTVPPSPPTAKPTPPPAPISTRLPPPGTNSPISTFAPVATSAPVETRSHGAVKELSKAGLIVPILVFSIILVSLFGAFLYAVVHRKRAFAASNTKGGLASLEGGGEEGSGEGSERPPPRTSWLRQLSARLSMPREDMRAGSFTRIEPVT